MDKGSDKICGQLKRWADGCAASAALDRRFHRWRLIDRWIDRVLLVVLLALAALVCAMVIDSWRTTAGGRVDADPRDFDTLRTINPDVVAWLILDHTSIDHPVVQGRDNFAYLDKAFEGGYYAGGTLFLDADNAADLSDAYSIIHGHHMANGAMFGGLERFLKEKYARRHQTGTLLTPTRDYDLVFLGVEICDAYDSRVFAPGGEIPPEALEWLAAGKQSAGTVQVLALSTCTGDMNDDRTVVFWAMTDSRPHTKNHERKTKDD